MGLLSRLFASLVPDLSEVRLEPEDCLPGCDLSLFCLGCGTRHGLGFEPSRTAYHRDSGEPDPNADILLCGVCAEHHHEYWDDMWDEYYATRF